MSVLEVEELLKTLPDSSFYSEQNVWNGKLVTIDNIDHRVLLSKTRDYIMEGDGKITVDSLEKKAKEIYNITEIKHQDFFNLEYKNGEYVPRDGLGGPVMIPKTKLIDYNIEADVLTIKQKVSFYNCGGVCYIAINQSFDDSSIIKRFEITDDFDVNSVDEYFENNLDKFTTYKYTFKKASDGKYYWYSSEPLSE